MKTMKGDIRRFLTINTTDYNGDGVYAVFDCTYAELPNIGWSFSDEYVPVGDIKAMTIDQMGIGDIVLGDNAGAYLMRVA